jgi:enoyl-CoA hydratase/carnithine racemase
MSILLSRRGSASVVTLNRPEQRNAMTLAMWRSLAAVFEELESKHDVRAIVLTGAGGTFCAGADIKEFAAVRETPEQGEAYADAVDGACLAIQRSSKPVIAAIEGACFGGGCGLALSCDFKLAHEDAAFAITAARLGIVYGVVETQTLLQAVGLAQARRVLFTARHFSAGEAAAIGLADEVVETNALEAALALAEELAVNAPLAIAGSKRILRMLTDRADEVDHAVVDELMRRAITSRDYRSAVEAFRLKRRPVFTGE